MVEPMTIDSSTNIFRKLSTSSPIRDYLNALYDTYLDEKSGEVASYIPELAKANPDWFGIAIITMDGHVYEVGDTNIDFTIQSISKPFVYGLSLEDNGIENVLKRVGVEPSGEAFNSISLRAESGQPFNPMINAGAIAATGLVKGKNSQKCFERIMKMFENYCGRALTVNETVYQSESETGHRNRAIGYMLRNFEILQKDPIPTLENYFRQCSISVNCRDLAVMAGTLANAGLNPLTGKRAVDATYVENILSIMGTCGMYDYAGEWIYSVGMPAKSGVAGGIVAVLPGQLGIGIFSPPLDTRGNSVRGIKACQKLSLEFNLHMFNTPNATLSAIRSSYTGDQVGSNRGRPMDERKFLHEKAKRIQIYELQGDLNFASTEVILRNVRDSTSTYDFLVLNFKRVMHVDESTCKLLYSFYLRLKGMNKHLILAETYQHNILRHYMEKSLMDEVQISRLFVADAREAVEFCENMLLLSHSGKYGGLRDRPLEDNIFFEGLSKEDLNLVKSTMKKKCYKDKDQIIKQGELSDDVYLLTKGTVSVSISIKEEMEKRLASFSAGVFFGELAIGGKCQRTANVYAEDDVECYIVSAQDLDALNINHPHIVHALMKNIVLETASRLSKANQTIAALS
ncbi:MAG: glutaminase A [Verrucomicrobiota bacterium]